MCAVCLYLYLHMSIKIDNEIIKASKTVKLLGIKMGNRLKFDDHVSDICNKVSRKLHALARTANVFAKINYVLF